ncbi:UDP-glucose dehydrogenase family protein [Marinilabilia rubra]|uniref:UDP-glucose 6-dehydrogenase n=1 Tax=Marinilabilia rubra TaxID=2162893 RepID=A0A2U2B6M5_9BACT|nr:UDP-glucose/GDP-mannose dehydrogenase family protein [Marinilabilia rubra]PWD98693.1 UDP-glucose 6-dehydrogenase [Marinilabilia rubra]
MKISIVGTGYVGLVTGTCFADTGVNVTCVDIDEKKISNLKKGIVPIYEPGLETMIKNNVDKGRLHFTTNLKESLDQAEVIFIAVGTPPGEDGSADLSHVLAVAREVGKNINHSIVVVTKSTVPIGTAEKVRAAVKGEIEARGVDVPFNVASNPEFLKEGNAIDDFLKPDRIVVGTDSEEAEKVIRRLYKPFLLNNHPILFMDIPSAELTKYAANSMLATKISFMNDIANLCELVGADVNMVRKGIGSDSRIGNKFIYPGIGYGGSCFPKDVKAIIRTANTYNYPLRLLQAVEHINEDQKRIIAAKVKNYFQNEVKGKTFSVWGLSFKPHTDDMREAPAIIIIRELLEAGAKIKAYDPIAMDEAKKEFNNDIEYGQDPYDVLIDSDGLLLLTEWPEFRIPNYNVMKKLMTTKVVFDGRNIYDMHEMNENGFDYMGIGRASKEDR